MKKYANKIATVLLLIFIAVTIYLISSTYMMAPDEYNYSHISWTDTKLTMDRKNTCPYNNTKYVIFRSMDLSNN